MEDQAPRALYRSRQNVRRVAQDIVAEITLHWPGTTVHIDLDGVDGEDAFLWIRHSDPKASDRVALTALELVNSLGASMGLWIVPRMVNEAVEVDESPHRLRLVRSDDQQYGHDHWSKHNNDKRNILRRN